MKIKAKNVYYCDFCKKHTMTCNSMELHEKHCTLNPNRECKMCGNKRPVQKIKIAPPKSHKEEFGGIAISGVEQGKYKDRVEQLLFRIDCPVCRFAILRQSEINLFLYPFNLQQGIQDYFDRNDKEYAPY